MESIRVFLTPHARQRMNERGGDPLMVTAAVRAAAWQVQVQRQVQRGALRWTRSGWK